MNNGYIYYAVTLFILTGILLLVLDIKWFRQKKMNRERKTSMILGWINIVLGIVLFTANWSYNRWFW